MALKLRSPALGTVRLVSTCVAVWFILGGASAHGHTSLPTPMPSAKGCDYFKSLYPATEQFFDKYHLTATQRAYVMKYVKQIPPRERRNARWMLDSDSDDGLLIFNAFPVRPDDALGSHAAWTAGNTNVGLDPIECRMFALPVAIGGQAARYDHLKK